MAVPRHAYEERGDSAPRARAMLAPPIERRRHRDAHDDRDKGRTDLDQQPGRQDRCADEELPAHVHIMVAKMTRSIAERTSAGMVSGFVHSTLRTQLCFSARISWSCLRAI